jgi:hypothetical protein
MKNLLSIVLALPVNNHFKHYNGSGSDTPFQRGYTMPRRKKSQAATEQPSKAEMIRQAAKSLGKKVRPRDIIAKLKEKGVEVSHALVSSTLKAAGFRRKRRGRKAGTKAVTKRTAATNGLSLDALIAAKSLIEKVGGIENAELAISALKKLQ